MKTIVVGYDETEPAKRALARAAELAEAFGSKLIVTSVARLLVGATAARGVGPIDPLDEPEWHKEQLERAEAFLAEQRIDAQFEVTLGGPAAAIVDLAEKRGADLIVVGTREPGLLQRLMGLSVSAAVENRAHCDVLIVH